MVGLQTLDLAIGVRVPASQPTNSLKTFIHRTRYAYNSAHLTGEMLEKLSHNSLTNHSADRDSIGFFYASGNVSPTATQ